MILKQGDTYYPFFSEPNSSVTSVDMLIIRDDGYFNDFDDSTFKDAAWTTKEQALTEKTEGIWIWATGWTIPSANRTYKILFKDDSGNVFEGPTVQVNQPPVFKKNTAFNNFTFPMLSSTNGNLATGLTVTAQRSIDGGTPVACANSVSEVGGGLYSIDFAAADLNGDVIAFIFTATGAKARSFTIPTET